MTDKTSEIKVASACKKDEYLKKEDVELAAFSIDKIGAFTTAEVKTLKKLGLRTVQDLDAFSKRIQEAIIDIVRVESTRFEGLTENENMRFLALKSIGITKFNKPEVKGSGYKYDLDEPIDVIGVKYDHMIFLVKEADKAAFDNASNAPCVSVKLQLHRIDPKLNIPVFTVLGFEKNEEASKLLEDDLDANDVFIVRVWDVKKFNPPMPRGYKQNLDLLLVACKTFDAASEVVANYIGMKERESPKKGKYKVVESSPGMSGSWKRGTKGIQIVRMGIDG